MDNIKTIKTQKSLLEEDIFIDPEQEREKYLKMFFSQDFQEEDPS